MELSRRNLGKLAVATGATAAVGTGAGYLIGRPADAAATWKTTGTAVSALAGFDTQMKAFMQARGVTAGQVAVTYKGRLVLARGYSTSTALTVQPTSLFRIASLSKSFTAAAIVKLVQDGKLSLSTPVANILDITPASGLTRDARWSTITLWKLLQHLGGWDRDVSGDPNFKDAVISRTLGVPLELQHADVIKYMAGQKLDVDPGTKYAYSNFGYLLAGRVIEKVSGLSYESYVKQKLLAPLKIKRMSLGYSIAKHSGETSYESQYSGPTVLDMTGKTVAAPYGSFSMRIQDANGGWIASAPDLVRWARMFDAPSSVLNSTSLGHVWAKPSTGVNADGWYYGLGWQIRPVTGGTGRNTWHTGSMPGTYTLLVRTSGGLSWAALFNRRDDASGKSYGDIDAAMWTAANGVKSWPTHDLFPQYFS
ncbi:CubicO group peptidase (beta-lactamase class C family) [Kribbella sp. VKM Ac-2569]|uniref:serine hydrolase domain-containing protein n=1 Tax=Kribbella sp. VKM Ac-2569 TaxID=2512220 RepID=UPI0010D31417|nr:serine hydrolase domain-containing protein [Kribbella sp. VKM Ac-2569]RZT13133.1 CubicO group peptidase (beta-lactamase class C family) [Kribbella sp. VKM Ac-2569]